MAGEVEGRLHSRSSEVDMAYLYQYGVSLPTWRTLADMADPYQYGEPLPIWRALPMWRTLTNMACPCQYGTPLPTWRAVRLPCPRWRCPPWLQYGGARSLQNGGAQGTLSSGRFGVLTPPECGPSGAGGRRRPAGDMAQAQGFGRRSAKAFLKGFFVAVPVTVTFLDRVACVARVEGASMQPSLNPGGSHSSDVVLLNHWKIRNYEVRRGDIVSLVWLLWSGSMADSRERQEIPLTIHSGTH
uniref:Mitochondrial inner membrane protease subunit 2 n=1 Tax=Ornithorhynchus anatinus TaxID=9258 RepID=A0A6I8N6W2_ORNAN